MKWHTEVPVSKAGFELNHSHAILALGSCFSQEIGSKLADSKFQININPFGTLYHPEAIAKVLEYGMENLIWSEALATCQQDIWYSWHHHGQISALSKKELLLQIESLHEHLKRNVEEADVIMLTFGTAWGYLLKSDGELVANCHKAPSHFFDKRLFSVEELAAATGNIIQQVNVRYPNKKFVLTLSPVRHIREGFHENQLSKATLLLSIETLVRKYENVFYFPAYEIMMDELRDYRFYAADKIHPTGEATAYIWRKFETWCMNESTRDLNHQISQLNQKLNHRPKNPDAPGYQVFRQKLSEMLQALRMSHPEINWEKEKILKS